MDLATFGAILRFAMDLERKAEVFYCSIGEEEACRVSRKRLQILEQARREGVSEMILESITGLTADDYASPLSKREDIAAFERTCSEFYRDAARKIPVPEVSRVFLRLAADHEASAGLSGGRI